MEPNAKQQLLEKIPHPAQNADKYSRGKAIIIAGSDAYPGAACLAGGASQRYGAGYTMVVTTRQAQPIVQAFRPSLVVIPDDQLDEAFFKPFRPERPCVYVVGPGFDASEQRSIHLTGLVIEHADAPVVIDGGAISAFARMYSDLGGLMDELMHNRRERGLTTVFTPHAGEAARLLSAVDEDPELIMVPSRCAQELARALHATVALKGSVTWVSECGAEPICMDEGTPALAKAGTGDVLAGIIGALLAQGLAGADAALLGSLLLAQAAAKHSDISFIPEDVL